MNGRDPPAHQPTATRELRWFGRFDPSACDAGEKPKTSEAVEHTRDRYAPLGAGCGLKLRSRRVEIKLRDPSLDGPQEVTTGRRFRGWNKWIIRPSQADEIADERWITIDKYRELTLVEVDPIEIQVERSELRTRGEHWWTIALELSGELSPHISSEVLQRCSQQLNRFEGSLEDCFCGSYPEWIDSFDGHPTPAMGQA